eukprot:11435129-Prorocentrum_lima.AAC.1
MLQGRRQRRLGDLHRSHAPRGEATYVAGQYEDLVKRPDELSLFGRCCLLLLCLLLLMLGAEMLELEMRSSMRVTTLASLLSLRRNAR